MRLCKPIFSLSPIRVNIPGLAARSSRATALNEIRTNHTLLHSTGADMAENLLTLADVANRTGFSQSHIRGLVQRGDVEHIRSNGTARGHIRFTEGQYERLVAKLTQAPIDPAPRPRRKRRAS